MSRKLKILSYITIVASIIILLQYFHTIIIRGFELIYGFINQNKYIITIILAITLLSFLIKPYYDISKTMPKLSIRIRFYSLAILLSIMSNLMSYKITQSYVISTIVMVLSALSIVRVFYNDTKATPSNNIFVRDVKPYHLITKNNDLLPIDSYTNALLPIVIPVIGLSFGTLSKLNIIMYPIHLLIGIIGIIVIFATTILTLSYLVSLSDYIPKMPRYRQREIHKINEQKQIKNP